MPSSLPALRRLSCCCRAFKRLPSKAWSPVPPGATAYGEHVVLGEHISASQRAVLTDPQTSGVACWVSCRPEVAAQVLLNAAESMRDGGIIKVALKKHGFTHNNHQYQ